MSLIIVLIRVKQRKYKGSVLQFLLFNLIVCTIFSYFWFSSIAIDGIGQVMGIYVYIVVAFILLLIQVLAVKITSRGNKTEIPK